MIENESNALSAEFSDREEAEDVQKAVTEIAKLADDLFNKYPNKIGLQASFQLSDGNIYKLDFRLADKDIESFAKSQIFNKDEHSIEDFGTFIKVTRKRKTDE